MAWWQTGEGNDVIGDMPADVIDEAASRQLERAGGTLTFAELLRAWEDALNAEPRALLSDAAAAAYTIRATASGAALEPAANPSAVELRKLALDALRDVAMTYSDAKNRLPRASELARALAFSLRHPAQAGRYADGPVDVERIVIAPLDGAAAP